MNIITILGFTAGICVTIAIVPQIITIWKTKKAQNISLSMFGITSFGILLWIIYGILKEDTPIMITNSISLALNIIMLYSIKHFENNNTKKPK